MNSSWVQGLIPLMSYRSWKKPLEAIQTRSDNYIWQILSLEYQVNFYTISREKEPCICCFWLRILVGIITSHCMIEGVFEFMGNFFCCMCCLEEEDSIFQSYEERDCNFSTCTDFGMKNIWETFHSGSKLK